MLKIPSLSPAEDELARFEACANGSKLPWHVPVVRELTPEQALAEGLIIQDEALALNPPTSNDVGHNKAPTDDREARKAFHVAALSDWIANRRQRSDDYVPPEGIGATKKDRPFLLQRAILDNVVAYYRQHPRTKVALGVLVIDTILSDNSDGCSTASAVRVAKLLGCDEKYVRRARKLLAKEHLMGREKRPGLGDRHWPIINRAFVGEDLHQTWWLDATSEAPARRGRPEKPRTPDVRPLPEKPQTQDVRPLEKTPDTTSENPGHQMSDDFTGDFTEEKKGSPALESGARVRSKSNGKGMGSGGTGVPCKAEIDDAFTEWWAHYPRKDDKLDAKKAYAAIVTGKHKDPECRATIPQLLAALKAHKFPKDREFTKLPATWLNKGSWASGAPPGGGPIKLPDCRDDPALTRRLLERLSPNDPWPAEWPPPGSADCRFHRGVLGELGFLSGTSADA
jgi:hypothetical protein